MSGTAEQFDAIRKHAIAFLERTVVGRREAEEGKVALRVLGSEGQSFLSLDEAISRLANEARAPDML